MKITTTVTGAEQVRRMLLRIGSEAAQQALASTVVEVEDYVGAEAARHNKTGRLVRSVDKQRITGGWEIFHDLQHAPHAVFVHWGTRPHKIRPKDKRALRFAPTNMGAFAKGVARGAKYLGKANSKKFGFVFSREVNHPGYKGDPWMVRAAAEAPRIFERHIAAQLARLTNGA